MIRKKYLNRSGLLLICSFLISISYSQIPDYDVKIFRKNLSFSDSVIFLPNNFIIRESEKIIIDSLQQLQKDKDYDINYITGKITFHNFKKDREKQIKIFYKILPTSLRSEYFHIQKIIEPDTIFKQKIIPEKKFSILSTDEIFGSNIKKSGSLIRGFSIGSNKDLTLNSGFRLQMNGNITEEIGITAALTDEKTPILPEGNTQSIKEIDKIFIGVNHKNFNVTLGDFYFENKSGELSNFTRKLQGGKLDLDLKNIYGSITYASPPGKFANNELLGVDGIQGPYKLKSNNGESNIIIIPGTERVHLDGKLLKRGDLEDYIIDYSQSEIYFTIKNMIKNNSRISVDFEFSDRKYNRNFFSIQGGGKLFNDRFSTSITFVQEGDDNTSPLNFEINDETRNLLSNAGNDINKASKPSISYIGSDSTTGIGKGQYGKIDTLIENKQYSYYVYKPGTQESQYSINFSYVGENKGDYIKESIGKYKWVGIGKGQYLPIQLFDLPDRNRAIIWDIHTSPISGLNLSTELALSNYDRNTLSNIDDQNNNGVAYNINLNFKSDSIKILNNNLGNLEFNFLNRNISKSYHSLERMDEVDYYRKWNINDSSDVNKNIVNFNIFYKPLKIFDFKYDWGMNKFSTSNKSVRNNLLLNFGDTLFPVIKFDIQDINTIELYQNNQFNYFNGSFGYKFQSIGFYFTFNKEKKILKYINNNELIDGYTYNFLNSQISLINSGILRALYEFEIRKDEKVINNSLDHEADRRIHRLSFEFSNKTNFNTNLNFGLQKKAYTEQFKNLGSADFENIFIKSFIQYSEFKSGVECNLFYETSKENSAIFQRIYLRVEKGQGNYKYLGDLNNNGIADESEFAQVKYDGDFIPISIKTDQYTPVTDLKTSFRLRISPQRFLLRPSNIFETVLNAISSESYIQINEINKDKESKNIFLLDLSKIQNEESTIKGNINFTQDVFVFDNSSFINFRLRYNERKSLSQYNFGFEKRYSIERSIRMRMKFFNEISNQTDFGKISDILLSPGVENRSYEIQGLNFITNFSYRPEQNIEFGFQIEGGEKDDRLQNVSTYKNSQSVRVIYSLIKKGNIQFEFERSEITFSNSPQYIPYNMTDGLLPGKNWLIKSYFDYQISSFLQGTFNYLCRVEGKGSLIHNASLEVKLFF